MQEGERAQSGEDLETHLQAEDGGEPWSLSQRLAEIPLPSIDWRDSEYYRREYFPWAAEGVWGYLIPLNSQQGTPITLENANTRPIAKPEGSYETGNLQRADKNPISSAGRYLIGRHSECRE
jgi:hypothetical protein